MTVVVAIAAAVALVTAIGVVGFRNTLYSALSLVVNVGSLAVIFLVLNAQFLFAVQLIIYAGAVMVLFVFIIALLNPGSEDRPVADVRLLIGLLCAAGITIGIFVAARNGITYDGQGFHGERTGTVANPYHAFDFTESAVNRAGNVQTVGGQLFTTYLLPFEITSLLLLVAAVGAVYLTRRPSASGR